MVPEVHNVDNCSSTGYSRVNQINLSISEASKKVVGLDDIVAERPLPGLEFTPDDVYVLEELDQVRAAATPLRVQILDCLSSRALTVRELGQELGINSTKLYYHVGELERVGLVRLVHTMVQGGIQQKYYRSRAHYYFLSPDLLRTYPDEDNADAGAAFMTSQLDTAAQALRASYLSGSINATPGTFLLSRRELRMSLENARELHDRLKEIDQLAARLEDPNADYTFEFVISAFPRGSTRDSTEEQD
jgi:AcrR family transcriptional regulator